MPGAAPSLKGFPVTLMQCNKGRPLVACGLDLRDLGLWEAGRRSLTIAV